VTTAELPTFTVVCVPISEYGHPAYPALPADEEARLVAEALSKLGGQADQWLLEPAQRHRTNVDARLSQWANYGQARNSVMLWLGHGSSNGDDAFLATYDSDEGAGVAPEDIARQIRAEWGTRRAENGAWTLVVIEACGAMRFAQLVGSVLQGKPNVPQRLAVIGVGSEGTSYLGDLRTALTKVIDSYQINDEEIRPHDLVGRISDWLGAHWVQELALRGATPIPLRRPWAGPVTAPGDVYAELREFLATLTEDERGHFMPKAQGAEQGELAWYFVGRGCERADIADWLRTRTAGLLVVTGRAGAGKSALLGNVLVHTNPGLRDLLTKAGHLESVADSERPPDNAFDAVVHLTGMTTGDLVRRISDAAGLPPHPAAAEPGQDVEALLAGIGDRPFTLLVDALDEAQQPASIASAVLRRIAALPGGRVVVGTRRSTKEGPDQPDTTDEDLLDALGRAPSTVVLEVERDPAAIAAYVRRRLDAARTAGALAVDDTAIERVVVLVGAQRRHFLFARLVVHEIIARPSLLDTDHAAELAELLSRDHRALFAAAVDRLIATAPVNLPLLEALALAQGRGLPEADRVWAIVASALSDEFPVTHRDITNLLEAAAPYIMLDAEDGQSVYRLAHQTFKEHFLAQYERS
jgi:hypothetical protein